MQSLLKPELLFKVEFKTEFGSKDAATLVSFMLEGNQKPGLQGRAKCRIFGLSSMSFTLLGQSFRAVRAALN
ncbi:hypothetical protein WH43_14535 [Rheinheimera sp. KL1]|jgi:hypothetical protein|nr:hypothetical protein WH43_14535 [Rheinheimera sp. KL1]